MHESDIQAIISKKRKEIGLKNGAYELKLVKRPRFDFRCLADHQAKKLLQVEGDGLYWKISDMSAEEKPFDFFFLQGPAYVIPVWYIPRKRKTAYFIRIKDFLAFRDRHTMKSMTEADARIISERTLEL